MKVKVKCGQTLADIAIQEFGSWVAIVELAALNDMSMTDTPTSGSELTLQNRDYDKTLADYCKANRVSPATGMTNEPLTVGVFAEEFGIEFS